MDHYARWYRTLRSGEAEKPRGLLAYVRRNKIFSYQPLTFIKKPKGNPAIGIMEGLQMIAGVFDLEAIKRVAPNAKHELFTPMSAYGPRIVNQLPKVLDLLCIDPATRQAVLLIAHPDDPLAERPCTLALQLHCQISSDQTYTVSSTAFMRSSDGIWGLPYDIIQFGLLTHVAASIVGEHYNTKRWTTGESAVLIGNAHIYEMNDPARISRPYFRTEGPLKMPEFSKLKDWQKWAAGLIKKTRVAGDLYNEFGITEILL